MGLEGSLIGGLTKNWTSGVILVLWTALTSALAGTHHVAAESFGEGGTVLRLTSNLIYQR